MITLTPIQLWIVNLRMISISTRSTLTVCCCKTLARSLSSKFNSEFKQIEIWIRKAKQKLLRASWIAKRIAAVQAELRKCETVKSQSCSKHPKANIETQSGKSMIRIPVSAELRSTRTIIIANKCDCTSFPPSQLFASPQQTHNCFLKLIRIQKFDFCFCQKWGSCKSCTRWIR